MTDRPVFFVTHHLRPAGVDVLGDRVELVFALPAGERARLADPDPGGARQAAIQAALTEWLPRAHALHSIGPVTREMMETAAELRVVVVPGSGYDNVDVDAASALGIPVVHAAGAAYEPVAEHVIGLMLALAKWIARSDRDAHRHQRAASNRAMLLTDAPTPSTIWGQTLGIVGLGFIGRSLAQKCRDAFGMTVVAYDPYADPAETARLGVRLEPELDAVLRAADWVSVNAPLTPETAGIIGTAQLAAMKPTAYLINTARGGLVDTGAVVAALQSGTIAGAGLDVTDPEPLPAGHPLFGLDNVVLTPHIGGIAADFLAANARRTSEDALLVLAGERPGKLVNPQVWDRYLERRPGLAGP